MDSSKFGVIKSFVEDVLGWACLNICLSRHWCMPPVRCIFREVPKVKALLCNDPLQNMQNRLVGFWVHTEQQKKVKEVSLMLCT